MTSLKNWISAFRLRTLPLAMASIGMGSFLAAYKGYFDGLIFSLCALTTVFLQILSNLANDYGDSIHGADSKDREGPSRAVQTGAISKEAMKRAMMIFVVLSLASGLSLLYVALGAQWEIFAVFLSLGLLAIAAAITYTSGYRPYGYMGLGDISVLLFFGLLGVLGTHYLFVSSFEWPLILPALSVGFFATGVLNINNIRDIESDAKAGKMSIPVRLGRERAGHYHLAIISLGVACAIWFMALEFRNYYQFLFLLVLPLLAYNVKSMLTIRDPKRIDPFLKQMALSTLAFVILFGLGLMLS